MSSPHHNPFSVNASCTTCPNGWYARSIGENDDTSCRDNCQSGRYIKGATIGAFLNCTICPSGKYQPTAHVNPSIACTTCIGSYILDDGVTETEHNSADDCKRCPAGKEYVSTTTECTVCKVGKYQSSYTVANAVCVPCDAGRYITDDGQYADKHVGCKFCPAGKEFVSTTTECTVCNAGKYQSSSDLVNATCVPCVGKYIVDDGENDAKHDSPNDCTFCPAGKEFVSTNATCRICSFSKFQNQAEVPGPVCQTCPANTFITDNRVEDVAHDQPEDCNACADGTVSNPGDQSCSTCPAGKRVFTNNQGVAGCDDCSAGKYQSIAGKPECESCPTGWYQTKTQQPFCLPW
jgi:hypothetical protein